VLWLARIFSCSGRCAKISLEFYGQTAIFDHFVRNRHFSSSPITDKPSIFIGVSVIGSDFAKCSAAQSLHLTLVTGKTVLFGICP
jgi:hypothetical protein